MKEKNDEVKELKEEIKRLKEKLKASEELTIGDIQARNFAAYIRQQNAEERRRIESHGRIIKGDDV